MLIIFINKIENEKVRRMDKEEIISKYNNFFTNRYNVYPVEKYYHSVYYFKLNGVESNCNIDWKKDEAIWVKVVFSRNNRFFTEIFIKGNFNTRPFYLDDFYNTFIENKDRRYGLYLNFLKFKFYDNEWNYNLYKKGILNLIDQCYSSYLEIINENKLLNQHIENKYLEEFLHDNLITEKRCEVSVRLVQGKFKDNLLRKHPNKCLICEINKEQLLIASHIKAWAASKEQEDERYDPNNGFLLCPTHDALFDKKLITFEDDGKILISEEITTDQHEHLNINTDTRIRVHEKTKDYLSWHREKFSEREQKRKSK